MILGAVLAGGRSTRFGSDKAEAVWHGRALIDHVIERLGTICDRVIVCGRDRTGVTWIADRPGPDLGPLGGLNAALHFAQDRGFDRVIAMPCDAPLIDQALLEALAMAPADTFLADMPVIGSWLARHAALLDAHLRCDPKRSMRGWALAVGAAPLFLPMPANVNRPGDLDALDGPR